MLAKLIAWGEDRHQSLSRMEEALRRFVVLGVVTNIPFLRKIVNHPQFQGGNYHTGFLAEHAEVLQPSIDEKLLLLARGLAAWSAGAGQTPSATHIGAVSQKSASGPWQRMGSWRLS